MGRSKDARPKEFAAPSSDGLGRSFVLEYRDDAGRLLTPNQAYRELSYAFHGRKPTQAQRDKYMKKEEKAKRQEAVATGNLQITSLSALHKAQAATGAAHITLRKT